MSLATITVSIKTDRFPEETGWRLETLDEEILWEVDPGTYTESSTFFEESFELRSGETYVLVVIDTMADGLCCLQGRGQAIVYYGNGTAIDKILAYDAGSITFGTKSYTQFLLSEDAIIDSRPIRPTSAAEGDFPVTITVDVPSTENWPQDINWRLERIDLPRPVVVLTAPPTTYFISGAIVDKVAYVVPGGLYRLDMRDDNFDGFDGQYSVYTDTTNSSDRSTRAFSQSGIDVFENQRHKFLARPATYFPDVDPRRISLEIQFDDFPSQLQWYISIEYPLDGGLFYDVVDYGPLDLYENDLANRNFVRSIRFNVIPPDVTATLKFAWTDSGRDGICCAFGQGYIRLWLGFPSDNQLLVESSLGLVVSEELPFQLDGISSTSPTASIAPTVSRQPTVAPTSSQVPTLSFWPSQSPSATTSPTEAPSREDELRITITVVLGSNQGSVGWTLRDPALRQRVSPGAIQSTEPFTRQVTVLASTVARVYRFELMNNSGQSIDASYRIEAFGRPVATGHVQLGERRIHDFSVGSRNEDCFPVTLGLQLDILSFQTSWFASHVTTGGATVSLGIPPLTYVFPNDFVAVSIMMTHGELSSFAVLYGGAQTMPPHFLVLGSTDADDPDAPKILPPPDLSEYRGAIWYTFVASADDYDRPVAAVAEEQFLTLEITNDNAAEEVGWILVYDSDNDNGGSTIFDFGPNVIGAQKADLMTVTTTIPLPLVDAPLNMTFVIFDRRGNGILPPGGYKLFDSTNSMISSGSISNGISELIPITVAASTFSPSSTPSTRRPSVAQTIPPTPASPSTVPSSTPTASESTMPPTSTGGQMPSLAPSSLSTTSSPMSSPSPRPASPAPASPAPASPAPASSAPASPAPASLPGATSAARQFFCEAGHASAFAFLILNLAWSFV